MKRIRFFSILIILVFVFSSIRIAADAQVDVTERVKRKISETMCVTDAKEYEGINNCKYQKFIEAISLDGKFPLYYAGAYVSGDHIIVLVTQKTEDVINEVSIAFDGDLDEVDINVAKYSLDELKKLQNKFIIIYEKEYSIICNMLNNDIYKSMMKDLKGFYIDEKNNELVVEIKDISDEKINAFIEIFGSYDAVAYVDGDDFTLTTAEWRPGRAIYKYSEGSLSTGYRCYKFDTYGSRHNGFITAGHAFSSGNYVYRTGNGFDMLGKCLASQFSGNNDAAFIEILDDDYVASNTMYYSDSTGGLSGVAIQAMSYITNVAQGSTVYKVGKTSYLTSGYVVSNSYTITYNGVTISDTLKTTALNLSGDSGGCAYMYYNNVYRAVGSMSGSSYSGDELNASSFTYSYISQIRNAVSDLGVFKY